MRTPAAGHNTRCQHTSNFKPAYQNRDASHNNKHELISAKYQLKMQQKAQREEKARTDIASKSLQPQITPNNDIIELVPFLMVMNQQRG